MYIALRWLVIFSIIMWTTLCCIDMFVFKVKQIKSNDTVTIVHPVFVSKNMAVAKSLPSSQSYKSTRNGIAVVHYMAFIAGALVVTIYNRKSDIVIYTRNQILKINTKELKINLKVIVNDLKNVALKIIDKCWKISKQFVIKRLIRFKCFNGNKIPLDGHLLNGLLLKKLREVGEERNNLAKLLYAAVQENKNVRLQHQLQTKAKNRLSSQIEDTQKQVKEYRTRCAQLQQLYLVTHQENLFLKGRVQKLIQDKQDTERDFMMLFTQVYQSNDRTLKSYCNRFIVLNKDNFLSSELSKQILRFVQKSRCSPTTPSTWQATRRHNVNLEDMKKLPVIEEVDAEAKDQSVSLIEKEPKPKLRGLPGEYVWTVKDKRGIIEKLYECDYERDFDNGDAIRRIREYTVYHDKDCLLDFEKSTTIIHDTYINESEKLQKKSSLDYLANRKFLTGSELFQQFLETNKNDVISPAPSPPLLCG